MCWHEADCRYPVGFDTFTLTTTLSFGDFFEASGTVTLQNSKVTLTLADGTSVEVGVVWIGGKDLAGFAGSGPYFVDRDLIGDIDGDDEPKAKAHGLAFDDVGFSSDVLSVVPRRAGEEGEDESDSGSEETS